MAYDAKKIYYRFDDHLSRLVLDYEASRQISPESENLYHGLPTDPYDEDLFVEHNVKRGLRNADGSGVVAGLTRISDVHGYNKVDGKVVPDQGKLTLRGYSIEDLVNNAQAENRYAIAAELDQRSKRSPICSLRALYPPRKSLTVFANVWALLGT